MSKFKVTKSFNYPIEEVAVVLQSFIGISRTKKKINRMEAGVTEEIELVRGRLEKNAKKA